MLSVWFDYQILELPYCFEIKDNREISKKPIEKLKEIKNSDRDVWING